jgi:DNA helicase-2/ATP-dependent DNA helicase PcrA
VSETEPAEQLHQAPPPERHLNLIDADKTRKRRTRPKALRGLNPQQEEAVEHPPGKLLVLAGAGSGKTRVLARRAAFLIEVRGETPESILAITLTNKAAREMKGRIRTLCGPAADRMNASTFHAMCARILRAHAGLVGRTPGFTIYDDDNAARAVQRVLTQAEKASIDARSVIQEIKTSKNQAVPLARYEAFAVDDTSRIVARVWQEYEQELRRADALDFNDLLLRTVQLLRANPDLRGAYQARWPSVLVDEYQDTNPVQAMLLRLLIGRAATNRNFMAVGDDKQVIYGFRLADVRLILEFEEEYPGASVVTLVRNYRNSPQILDGANSLIARNKLQRPMTLVADEKNRHGPPITVHWSASDTEEAKWIASKIQSEIEQGAKEKDIAVLARRQDVVDRLEHALAAAGISYQLVGSRGFFRHPEVRAALAHLRVIVNPRDEAAFVTALEVRPEIGGGTVAKIIGYAVRNRLTLLEASMAADLLPGNISSKARENVRRFALDMLAFAGQVEGRSVSDLTHDVIRMPLGVADSLASADRTEHRFERLEALCEAARTYERQTDEPSLAGWLADVMLAGRDDLSAAASERGRVTLGTIHAIKGLEWLIVIGAGFEGKVIPSYRARTPEEIEEERRMAYVLMTRAIRVLIFSYALRRNGRQSGPSPFISEAIGHKSHDGEVPSAKPAK